MPETVTLRDPEICNAEFDGPDVTHRSHVEAPDTLHPAITFGDRARGWVAAARAYWTPPEILTKRPPAVSALSAYAKAGAWTRQVDGPIRRAGVWWFRLIGVPVTVACRFAEWVWQRPGRAIPVLVLCKVLALTTPGAWLVDAGTDVVSALAWALL